MRGGFLWTPVGERGPVFARFGGGGPGAGGTRSSPASDSRLAVIALAPVARLRLSLACRFLCPPTIGRSCGKIVRGNGGAAWR